MGKIDIHNLDKLKEKAVKNFKDDNKISQKQKKSFLKFVSDCEIGKNGRVVSKRLNTYIGNFRPNEGIIIKHSNHFSYSLLFSL